jgi:hypothetical protein
MVESIEGTEYNKYEYDLDEEMLETLIKAEPNEWIQILNSNECFMRSKKKKNTKFTGTAKKVFNLTGMFSIKKKKEELEARPLTGKNKAIETSL